MNEGWLSVGCEVQGWDKTYCLRFVEEEFGDIHFFGDKTFQVWRDGEMGHLNLGGRAMLWMRCMELHICISCREGAAPVATWHVIVLSIMCRYMHEINHLPTLNPHTHTCTSCPQSHAGWERL
jgi:hypothetical protein